MKSAKHTQELDVDFIQSKPLTEKEEKELSEFIQKLNAKNNIKKILKRKLAKQLATV